MRLSAPCLKRSGKKGRLGEAALLPSRGALRSSCGGRRPGGPGTAIAGKTEANEADQHHRPGRGLGNSGGSQQRRTAAKAESVDEAEAGAGFARGQRIRDVDRLASRAKSAEVERIRAEEAFSDGEGRERECVGGRGSVDVDIQRQAVEAGAGESVGERIRQKETDTVGP